MKISPDFREFVALLNSNDVRYLIVGGYAVGLHGHPRYTKDLDVWIDREAKNVERLMGALSDFGFGSVGLETSDFTSPNTVIQLGHPPQRIDVLTSCSGVEFDDCFPNRMTVDLDGVELKFIGLDDLRMNKEATGRYQDLADLENLAGNG